MQAKLFFINGMQGIIASRNGRSKAPTDLLDLGSLLLTQFASQLLLVRQLVLEAVSIRLQLVACLNLERMRMRMGMRMRMTMRSIKH